MTDSRKEHKLGHMDITYADPDNKLLLAGDAGRRCDPPMGPNGIRQAVTSGRLKPWATTEGGVMIFTLDQIRAFNATRPSSR